MEPGFEPGHDRRFLVLLSSQVPLPCALYPPMAWCNPGNRWLVMGEVKERNYCKNPSSAICEANADTRAMYGRKGIKKWNAMTWHADLLNNFVHPVQLVFRPSAAELWLIPCSPSTRPTSCWASPRRASSKAAPTAGPRFWTFILAHYQRLTFLIFLGWEWESQRWHFCLLHALSSLYRWLELKWLSCHPAWPSHLLHALKLPLVELFRKKKQFLFYPHLFVMDIKSNLL